jgi:hypothetical protein
MGGKGTGNPGLPRVVAKVLQQLLDVVGVYVVAFEITLLSYAVIVQGCARE